MNCLLCGLEITEGDAYVVDNGKHHMGCYISLMFDSDKYLTGVRKRLIEIRNTRMMWSEEAIRNRKEGRKE